VRVVLTRREGIPCLSALGVAGLIAEEGGDRGPSKGRACAVGCFWRS
jgi:hypothetical protein